MSDITAMTTSVTDLSDWKFASTDVCKRENIFPNQLAYCEDTATLAVVVRRSPSSRDFALGEGGLKFISAALEKGERKDGKPVFRALVILAEAKNGSQSLKVVHVFTAEEMGYRFRNVAPNPSNFSAPYWWISADEESW
jgi:hypothetical protein